jgi:ubiquinone/menaquinone biosynthesis C-methylase UbiE
MTSNPWLNLVGLINGFQITQAIHVASTLRLADHLKDGPRSAEELAPLTQSHAGALYRLLRALAAVGVFREDESRRFALTSMGDCLRTDSATPIGAWAECVGSPYVWRTWGHLLHSVRTGENAFQSLNGEDIWNYRAEHSKERAVFDRAMTEFSRGGAEAVIDAYDFSVFNHVVDVGGGRGLMLAALLKAHPQMQGTLFDQPGVVAEAEAVLKEHGVVDRCRMVGGSFFEMIPEGGDAYLMRVVIHDWDDNEAITILKTCRRAMRETAKLILIERIIAPANEIPATKFMDLHMLALPGGRERTSEEFSDLFARAGFKMMGVESAGRIHVIEAEPH